ncbi:hypothetical protein HID58_022784, partial [Brassica napus]
SKSTFSLVRCLERSFSSDKSFKRSRSIDFVHGERVFIRRVRWCAKECLISFVSGHNSPTFTINPVINRRCTCRFLVGIVEVMSLMTTVVTPQMENQETLFRQCSRLESSFTGDVI